MNHTITVNPGARGQPIGPGYIGAGSQFQLWYQAYPNPPTRGFRNEAERAKWWRSVIDRNCPLLQQVGIRILSAFSGANVANWIDYRKAAGPWEKRQVEYSKLEPASLRPSPIAKNKALVNYYDFMDLLQACKIEAMAVGIPIDVWSGHFSNDFGPSPTGSFAADERAKFIEFAKGQYEYLTKHPYWNSLKLVIFTPAGEWRKYSLGSNSFAADWIALMKDLRAAIPDRKVWMAFNFSDSAAFELDKANNWNAPTYEALCNIPGIVGDRHYYRPSRSDVHSVLNAGLLEEPFMAVAPNQWRQKSTKPCPFIVKEFAVSGAKGGDRRNKTWNYPWFVAMGFMDLLRSSMRSGALVNMAWQWMPEDIPNEWPYGMTTPDGRLQPHALALSSITPMLYGEVTGYPEDREIRCVTTQNGRKFGLWCGNFSQQPRTVSIRTARGNLGPAKLARLVDGKFSSDAWNGQTPVAFKPLEMIRFDY